MPDSFTITIILIIICTVAGAFVKGRSKDACLADFSSYPVFLEKKNGKTIWGRLKVENSGIELLYDTPSKDADGHIEESYILFKNEYPDILALKRICDDLSDVLLKKREKALKKAQNPFFLSRVMRYIRNFTNTIRDSLLEVSGLFIGRMKTMNVPGRMMKGQDKYVSDLKTRTVDIVAMAYEPILERYIGKMVVLSVSFEAGKKEYHGILKEYTTDYIELLDIVCVDPRTMDNVKADVIIPRTLGVVRHFGGK